MIFLRVNMKIQISLNFGEKRHFLMKIIEKNQIKKERKIPAMTLREKEM